MTVGLPCPALSSYFAYAIMVVRWKRIFCEIIKMTIFLAIMLPLFISLISYSALLTFKHIEYRATIKRLDKELTAARAELATFDQKKNQSISDIKEISDTRINELIEENSTLKSKLAEYSKFISHNNLLWLPDDPMPFCFRCWDVGRHPVHMEEYHGRDGKDYYTCPKCNYSSIHSEHPNENQLHK